MPEYEYAVLYEDDTRSMTPGVPRVRVLRREHAEKIVATDAAHGIRSVVQRRQLGDWETVTPEHTPAEETSAPLDGSQVMSMCPMTHLPEMACGTCGKPAETEARRA